jgi:biotin carboxyl carrier protein
MKKYNITVNGTTYEVIVEEAGSATSAPTYTPPATITPVAAPAPKTPAPKASAPATAGSSTVTAPMPGTILDVKVSVGQSINKGDIICVLEAMKMENDIPSPQSGVVASINVQKGSSVNANDVIITLN